MKQLPQLGASILGSNAPSKEFEWECFFVLLKVVASAETNIGFRERDLRAFGCKVTNGLKSTLFSKVQDTFPLPPNA